MDFPLKLAGRKFDLGVYVLVHSLLPSLRATVMGQVLVRACAKPYPITEAQWRDQHRTVVSDTYTPAWSIPTLGLAWARDARTVSSVHALVKTASQRALRLLKLFHRSGTIPSTRRSYRH